MASLTKAWEIVSDPAHQPFRNQVEMAMWQVAKNVMETNTSTAPERQLAVRVLRGDVGPAMIAVKAAMSDNDAQDAYVAGGNKLPDATVVQWLANHWAALSGLG